MGMKILGLEQLIAGLGRMGREVTDEARQAMREGAADIERTAIRNAPVLTYKLESSIRASRPEGNQHYYRVTVDVLGDGNLRRYAALVEQMPWNRRGPLTRMKGPAAGPGYMRRAYAAHRKEIERRVADAIGRGVLESRAYMPKRRRR